MKFVSLDIETTGLDPDQDQILEIAMVVEDTDELRPIPDLPTFRRYIWWDRVSGSLYALVMNAELLQEILADEYALDLSETLDYVYAFLDENFQEGVPIIVAGKNVAGFDVQFFPEELRSRFHHRKIDVGSVAMADSSRWDEAFVPGLGQLVDDVPHTALGDARAVLKVLRELTGNYGHGE